MKEILTAVLMSASLTSVCGQALPVKESLGNAGLSSVVIQKISDGGFVSF